MSLNLLLNLLTLLSMQSHAAINTASVLEVLSKPQETRVMSAREKSSEMYPSLIQVAFSEEHSIPMRWKALTLASQINPEGAKPDLDRALRSKEWFMRNAALTAIKSTRPELLNEIVPKLIQDKALVVRSAAVGVLDPKLEPKMRDLLWKELNAEYNFRKGQSLWVRGQIVEKLAANPEKREYAAFGIALRSSDTTLHVPAIIALEKLTNKRFAQNKAKLSEQRKLWLEYVRQNPNL